MTDDLLRLVADRQEITILLHRYARGIDRCDEATLLSVWEDGAQADYGSGWEDARAWCHGVLGRLHRMTATMHALSNIIIDVYGEEARAETYCQAYHLLADHRRMIVGGRYLDELRHGPAGWKIARRRYVLDWNETEPSTALFGEGPFARFTTVGGRYPDDPLYAIGD
ncbi:MAG TPA: nuclear transport factor 2 family protein [Sphingobium sp.]|nr:nuclear transport factor 2 family protein [Sphingobium sp.]